MSEDPYSQVLNRFLQLVAIDAPSGHEHAIRKELSTELEACDCSIEYDQNGNLYALFAASSDRSTEPPILFNAHMDTVPIAVGVTPVVTQQIVTSDGTTALGADDKAALAAIITALEILHAKDISHPPIFILFTVSEETGLSGAKQLDIDRLKGLSRGYTLDSSSPVGTVIVDAPYKYSIEMVFHGRSAHAGIAPEQGTSAISIAAKAIDSMHLLRIDNETTANIGTIHGGTNTNIVCDCVKLEAEVRSLRNSKAITHIEHLKQCCQLAIDSVGGSFEYHVEQSYPGYHVTPSHSIIKTMKAACTTMNIEYRETSTGGGSDANILRDKGIEIAVLGTGYEKAHTYSESITVDQLIALTRLVVFLATYKEQA